MSIDDIKLAVDLAKVEYRLSKDAKDGPELLALAGRRIQDYRSLLRANQYRSAPDSAYGRSVPPVRPVALF